MRSNSPVLELLSTGLAEFFGTGFLVLLGCMGCVSTLGVIPSHFQIALTFGLAVLTVIQCFGHISHAHVNPAITLGALILKKKSIKEGAVYFVAQILGATVGYGVLKVLTPTNYLTSNIMDPEAANKFCVTGLHKELDAVQGLLLEGIATFVLMLVACAVWDRRNSRNSDSVSIRFGLVVAVLATAFGPYTGCSMNPARSFGPALWNMNWSHHWIYWLGPLGGSLFASLAYKLAFQTEDSFDEDAYLESVRLNSLEARRQT